MICVGFLMVQIGLSAKTPRELLMKAGELLGEHKKMKDKVKRLEKEVKHLEKHKGTQVRDLLPVSNLYLAKNRF